MTQALRDARDLAAAIEGVSPMPRWSVLAWSRCQGTAVLSSCRANPRAQLTSELNRLIFARVGKSPELIRRFWRQFEHDIDPSDAVPFQTVLMSVLDGILKGQLKVLPQFARHGLRIRRSEMKQETFRNAWTHSGRLG